VRRAEAGETFIVTVHGRLVAQLGQTAAARQRLSPSDALKGLLEFRRAHHLGGTSLSELVDAGRRS
jgi:antitoxin (DNA-binding transcriptional repressor) of toxin-antitoxin stability system